MTSIKTTKQTVHITIPNTEKIDVSKIYNRVFFDAFKIQGVRIYIRNTDDSLDEDISNEATPTEPDMKQFSDIFGKEQTPNGYSTLPLELKPDQDSPPGKEDGEKEEEEEEIGIVDSIRQYVSRFISSKETPDALENVTGSIMISVPLDVEHPIVTIDNLYEKKSRNTRSIYESSKSNVDYEFIENVLRDLFVQYDYLEKNGLIYNQIDVDTLYRVQDRFLVLDSTQLTPIVNETAIEQRKMSYLSVVACIAKLLGQEAESDFANKFADIQDTRAFYVLKRLELEGVFEWI
jgi:hypothetical protein